MAVIAEDAGNVPKLLKVDSSGNLKTAETGDWLPSAKGKTAILKHNFATNQTTTIHTVTTGKTFYLVHAMISITTVSNAEQAYLLIGSARFVQCYSKVTATYNTSDSRSMVSNPSVPIPIPSATVIAVFSSSATLSAVAGIAGWEE